MFDHFSHQIEMIISTKPTNLSPQSIISNLLQDMYLQQSHQLLLTDCVIILLGYD